MRLIVSEGWGRGFVTARRCCTCGATPAPWRLRGGAGPAGRVARLAPRNNGVRHQCCICGADAPAATLEPDPWGRRPRLAVAPVHGPHRRAGVAEERAVRAADA